MGFGDESADANKERVFAVAAVFGTEDEWDDAMRKWMRRTKGLPFHATDCEAVQGPEREAALALYGSLAHILADSFLVGVAFALNIKSYREVLGHAGPDEDWHYFKALSDLIASTARMAQRHNAKPDERAVRLKFTFDSRIQSNGTAGTMYTMLVKHPDWAESDLLDTEITFQSGDEKSLRLEIADLFVRESMKELDRKITGIPSKIRYPYTLLKNTGKFIFEERDTDYWVAIKEHAESPQSAELLRQWDAWLLARGRTNHDGTVARTMSNWYQFNAWLDNQDVLKKKKNGGASSS